MKKERIRMIFVYKPELSISHKEKDLKFVLPLKTVCWWVSL